MKLSSREKGKKIRVDFAGITSYVEVIKWLNNDVAAIQWRDGEALYRGTATKTGEKSEATGYVTHSWNGDRKPYAILACAWIAPIGKGYVHRRCVTLASDWCECPYSKDEYGKINGVQQANGQNEEIWVTHMEEKNGNLIAETIDGNKYENVLAGNWPEWLFQGDHER